MSPLNLWVLWTLCSSVREWGVRGWEKVRNHPWVDQQKVLCKTLNGWDMLDGQLCKPQSYHKQTKTVTKVRFGFHVGLMDGAIQYETHWMWMDSNDQSIVDTVADIRRGVMRQKSVLQWTSLGDLCNQWTWVNKNVPEFSRDKTWHQLNVPDQSYPFLKLCPGCKHLHPVSQSFWVGADRWEVTDLKPKARDERMIS